ncbi:hypothetical protein [Ornithinimicrobium pratense]|uniref:Uncharacterized protein n=1 Tax=Ornithinimicrobium pratense TaxID=2593973 RepID=A0A5J6V5W4_9MICO|nr:hypothetical protein [Ornithinimicrobium pratense]QFG68987.1 hypothetical protein FY030_09960 [Ornithinimicrobium pratense]
MTQLLVFLLGALVALMVLGHLATPLGERQPPRRWTPVYLMDRVPHAITLFREAGALQRRRLEQAAAERESQVKDQGRRVEDLEDTGDTGDTEDPDGEDPRGRT